MQMSSNQAEQACGVIIQSVLNLPGRTGLERRASFSRLTESSFFASKLDLTGIFSARRICARRGSKCGSEPARDGGGSGARDVGCGGLIASRLAPTSIFSAHRICVRRGSKCGSEPARDGGVSGARDVGCSGLIASKLAPQVFSAPAGSAFGGDQKMWERACSRWRSVRRQGCWL